MLTLKYKNCKNLQLKKIKTFLSAGTTLIEMLIAVAIMGVMGLMVAGLAVSLNKGSVQTEFNADLIEYVSKLSTQLSLKNVCDYNFKNESMNQENAGPITDLNGKVLLAVGGAGPKGYSVTQMSLAQGGISYAELTIKFNRSDGSASQASQIGRKIRINVVPSDTDAAIIKACNFDVSETATVAEDGNNLACFGQGALLNTNATPMDPTDDACLWAGYSTEICPNGEAVARYKLIDISTTPGKLVPMYIPVCAKIKFPQSMTCPDHEFLLGYSASSGKPICRPFDISDISQYFQGQVQDCSGSKTYPIGLKDESIDGSQMMLNLDCVVIPTPTPTPTPMVTTEPAVWSLHFSATPNYPSYDYGVVLKLNGTPVPVATATYKPLAIFARPGSCAGSNTEVGLAPIYDSAKDCRFSSPYGKVWPSNARTCNVGLTGAQWGGSPGVIAYAYTDASKNTILAQTNCVPYLNNTPTPTPPPGTPTPTPTPTPSYPPGTDTPVPTPTPTQVPNCALSSSDFVTTTNPVEGSGTFSLPGSIPIGASTVKAVHYVYKSGNFDETLQLDAIPLLPTPEASISNANPSNPTSPQLEVFRIIGHSLFVAAAPAAGNYLSVKNLANMGFSSAGYWYTKTDPACTTNCNYSGATTFPTNSWGGVFNACWNTSMSGNPIYMRIKRVGNTLSWACSNGGPPAMPLTYSSSLAGCGMDNGLYLGVSSRVSDGGSAAPWLFPSYNGVSDFSFSNDGFD